MLETPVNVDHLYLGLFAGDYDLLLSHYICSAMYSAEVMVDFAFSQDKPL